MSKELVISSNRHETKVALIEDDLLCEVYFQRANEYSLAGSIHKGRVTRVLPGMQSAFVDLGLERDTFLYVSDFLEEHEDFDKITGDERPLPREREGRDREPRERDRDRRPPQAVQPVAPAAEPGESAGKHPRLPPQRRRPNPGRTIAEEIEIGATAADDARGAAGTTAAVFPIRSTRPVAPSTGRPVRHRRPASRRSKLYCPWRLRRRKLAKKSRR